MRRSSGAMMVFYHHTTLQRAHDLLLYGFPSGADGIDVPLMKEPKPADGQVAIQVAVPPDIGYRAWNFARRLNGTEIVVPGSLLISATLTIVEAASVAGEN